MKTSIAIRRFILLAVLAASLPSFAQQGPPWKKLPIISFSNVDELRAYIQKLNLSPAWKSWTNINTTPQSCTTLRCPITLTVVRPDPESDLCLITPSPYEYDISKPAFISWTIQSPGFKFHDNQPLLYSYPDPNSNDPAYDIFDPPLQLDDAHLITLDLHGRKRRIRYDFQIDYQTSTGDYQGCLLVDPVIYNM